MRSVLDFMRHTHGHMPHHGDRAKRPTLVPFCCHLSQSIRPPAALITPQRGYSDIRFLDTAVNMVGQQVCSFVVSALFVAAMVPFSSAFVTPGASIRPKAYAATSQVTMAAKAQTKFEWVPVLPIKEAPSSGTAKSVFVADLDLCVAADEKGLLYVLGNKCPPANQPLSFSLVVNNCIKDPVLGTKIDIETGDVVEWCPSILGKLLSPILGPQPEDAGVNVFKVRSKGGILEAYLNVNARAEYESAYWTGILDAQGKADGGYY